MRYEGSIINQTGEAVVGKEKNGYYLKDTGHIDIIFFYKHLGHMWIYVQYMIKPAARKTVDRWHMMTMPDDNIPWTIHDYIGSLHLAFMPNKLKVHNFDVLLLYNKIKI